MRPNGGLPIRTLPATILALSLLTSVLALAPAASAAGCLIGDEPECIIRYQCPWDCDDPTGEGDAAPGIAPPCVAGQEDRCWVQFVTCVRAPCPPRLNILRDVLP